VYLQANNSIKNIHDLFASSVLERSFWEEYTNSGTKTLALARWFT